MGHRSTVRFVEDFYSELARGRPVVEALRAAKLAAIKEGAPPGVWAAFSVVGDLMVRMPLRAPRAPVVWWAGGGLAVIAIVMGAARRRRSAPADPQLPKR